MKLFQFETEPELDANGEIIKTEMVAKDVLIPIKSLVGNINVTIKDGQFKRNQPKFQ